jgi:hypothetical protein
LLSSATGRIAFLVVHSGASDMQDLVWIGVILGLLGLSLAYIRLCDNA